MTASWFVSDDRVPVEVAECLCPGTPHTSETIWLRAELDAGAGFAMLDVIDDAVKGKVGAEEAVGRLYLERGIVDWTFLDGNGEKVPPTRANIVRLAWNETVRTIAEKASDLYGGTVLDPLVARLSKSSLNGQTGPSTSVNLALPSKRRRR